MLPRLSSAPRPHCAIEGGEHHSLQWNSNEPQRRHRIPLPRTNATDNEVSAITERKRRRLTAVVLANWGPACLIIADPSAAIATHCGQWCAVVFSACSEGKGKKGKRKRGYGYPPTRGASVGRAGLRCASLATARAMVNLIGPTGLASWGQPASCGTSGNRASGSQIRLLSVQNTPLQFRLT